MNYIQRWHIVRRLKKQFYELNVDELNEHKVLAATKIWTFVREHSPYYKNLYPFPTPIDEVAPISRSVMMDNFNAINTAHLDRDSLVQLRIEMERKGVMEYFNGRYSIGLSSGTTGSRLLTVLSKEERDMYTCLLWARSGIPESVKAHRVLFSLRAYNPAFTEISVFGVKIVYVDYSHTIDDLIRLVNKKRLNILAGPPSLLLMIASQSERIDHPIDAIVSYAEVLDENARDELQFSFRAPVVQIYQGAEGFIGTTCRDGHLHLNEDVLLVEAVEDPAIGPTKVLLTDLHRRTQPLIRYRLDDLLELGTTSCSCGSAFRTIKRIHGRADEVFVLFDLDDRPRYLFPDYVRRAINQSSNGILEYQAIQHTPKRIEIRLLLKDERKREQIEIQVLKNLVWRVEKIGAELGMVEFSKLPPERNSHSNKLVRVTRKFPWNV